MSTYENRIIVAEIDTLAADLCAAYETLPPGAQAKVLRVANSLSNLRNHFARDGRGSLYCHQPASTRDTYTAEPE